MTRALSGWLLALAVWIGGACASVRHSGTERGDAWVASWIAPEQTVEPRNLPPPPGLAGNTLRQVARVSLGGSALRVHLSNGFGTETLTVKRARIALSEGGSAVIPGSGHAITFGGRTSVVLAAGERTTSDPIALSVTSLSDVTVSLHVGTIGGALTGHPGSRTTSYIAQGGEVASVSLPTAVRVERWYLLSGIDVLAPLSAATVVVLGNSIADGRGSGTDRNNRWPDNLAHRLHEQPSTLRIGVLNAGIGGNAVIRGGLGPPALERLERDVLERPGARWLIVSEGVNDIGGARGGDAAQTVAGELIRAYEEIIARARKAGLRVYGATILPFGGSQYDDPAREGARARVNDWIRSSGAFNAVLDLDAAMRDPANPLRLRPGLDSGDHLHPNEAGYRVMADAIDLHLFVP